MNVKSAIFVLLSGIFLNSCVDSEGSKIEEHKFVVMGSIKNAKDRTLVLTIPSLYPNEQLYSKVENGQYFFQGIIPNPEKAIISIEGEDDFPKPVFLSQDTIKLDLEIGEMWERTVFITDSLIESDLNMFYRESSRKFYDAISTTVFGDPVKRDSMRIHIYPQIRNNVYEFYDQQFTRPEHSVVALYFLNTILDFQGDVFFTQDLSETEKQRLYSYFHAIDPALKNTPEYETTAIYIEQLKNPRLELDFVDYALVNEKGEEIKFSEIIAKNRYTVIDFWWSGCGPCRKFNKEGKELYAGLKEKGIEIVGVNTDTKRSLWNKSSQKDQIEWTNLYAGSESKILADYRIEAYPTKIIFDRNGNRLNPDIKTWEDISKLGETEQGIGSTSAASFD